MTGLAICGVGKIGEVHLDNLASVRGCRLIGIYDTDAERLRRVSARTGVRACTSLESLLSDDSVNAVVVATPSGSHSSVACQAMQAGKHVFIEKPLAATIEECQLVIETARRTGRIAQAGFCERFNVNYLEAKRAVASGKIGKVRTIHTSRVAPYSMSDPAWPLGVLDTSVHNLDLILWLMDREPKSVLARGTRVYSDSDVFHSATILLGFADGAMAAEHIAWIQDEGHPLNQCARSRMTVHGSQGAFFIDLSERPSGLLSQGEYREIDTVIIGGPEYAGCLKLQFEYFLRSLEEGAPVLAPLADALRTERVVLAAKASLESRQEVFL
jgi:predicted dehydrogenase